MGPSRTETFFELLEKEVESRAPIYMAWRATSEIVARSASASYSFGMLN